LLFVGIKFRNIVIEKPVDFKLLVVLMIASVMFFIWGVSAVDFDGNHYENMPLMYVSSIAISLTVIMAVKLVGGGQILPVIGQETLLLMGYNYAINGVLLTIVPSIEHSWLMALLVVAIGCILVFITRKVKIIKKILI
jgi:fucose 4-O-acetylase-like acetyltransferase